MTWRRVERVGAGICLAIALAIAAAASPVGAKPAARSGTTLKITTPSKHTVSKGFVGLTFEATTFGSAYLDPASSNLPSYLSELGPGNLRFGGQTSDLNVAWLPDASDPLPSWASSGITPGELATV